MFEEEDIVSILRELAAPPHNPTGYVDVSWDLLDGAADEIKRLRDLIIKWADADDAWTDVSAKDGPQRSAYAAAHDALRKAVGR